MPLKKFINNQLITYLGLEISQKNITIADLASASGVDVNYINYIFKNKYKIKRDKALLSIISCLNLDEKSIFERNLKFEKIRNDFFYAVFYCLDDRKNLYNKVQDMSLYLTSSPYLIDYLMIDYVYTIGVIEDYSKINIYLSKFSKILPFLSCYYRKLYYVFLLYYLDNSSEYKEILEVYEKACAIPCKDSHLNGRILYLGMSIYRSLGSIKNSKKYYYLAKENFIKMHNTAMLENLNMKYSALLRSIGNFNEALENDINILTTYQLKKYRLQNVEILYNNIAWTYSLIHDYANAIIYYQKALETIKDNEIYFSVAYCCYKNRLYSQAKQYIYLGKSAKSFNQYFYYLLDWLEEMIEERYSEKTQKMLINIIKEYGSNLDEIVKNTIKIEIINYYYYNHMYEEAIHALQPLMGKQLISPSELIFTKKNENRHDLLFSEDELTLRSQMMESDDLFFEDDELGEDEWEELDDSFSRFTHN